MNLVSSSQDLYFSHPSLSLSLGIHICTLKSILVDIIMKVCLKETLNSHCDSKILGENPSDFKFYSYEGVSVF